jgi:hypothetical protein
MDATMFELAPPMDAAPGQLVTVQLSPTVPELPAVKAIMLPFPVTASMVPFEIPQE